MLNSISAHIFPIPFRIVIIIQSTFLYPKNGFFRKVFKRVNETRLFFLLLLNDDDEEEYV